MKYADFVEEADAALKQDLSEKAVARLKELTKEIVCAKRVLKNLEKELAELLDADVDPW